MDIIIADGGIEFIRADATLREVLSDTSQATRFPVEDGTSVVDHVLQLPSLITAELVISNDPVVEPEGVGTGAETRFATRPVRTRGVLGNASVTAPLGEVDRVQRVYQTLIELKQKATVLTIATELKQFTNMILTRVEVPRTADTGRAAFITVDFEEIRIVSSRQVPVPPTAVVRRKPKVQDNKAASEAAARQEARALQQQSLFSSAVGAF